MSESRWFNSLQNAPPARPLVKDDEPLFETTPPEEYDLNSYLPVAKVLGEDWKVKIEPLVPSLHGAAIVKAFMREGEDPIFYPSGVPFKTEKEGYKWIESQRRRSNLLMGAIILKETGQVCGTVGVACDPTQGTMDARGLAAKVFPEYRRRGIITHVTFLQTCYLLDPVEQGGLGLVRVSWRCIPENKESAGAALKSGYTYEGTMRNYTVYPAGSKHKYARAIPDNTGRVVEDGMVFSLTIEDWITGGKREMMQKYLYLTQPKPAEVAAPAPTETETAAPAAPAAE